jgi:hypothetical protein
MREVLPNGFQRQACQSPPSKGSSLGAVQDAVAATSLIKQAEKAGERGLCVIAEGRYEDRLLAHIHCVDGCHVWGDVLAKPGS